MNDCGLVCYILSNPTALSFFNFKMTFHIPGCYILLKFGDTVPAVAHPNSLQGLNIRFKTLNSSISFAI